MEWVSWSEFWRMGGYGLYVWGSYTVTAIVLAAEVLTVRKRRRLALAHARQLRAASGGAQ